MYPDPENEMDDNVESQEIQAETESEIQAEKSASANISAVPEYVTPGKYLLTEREKAGLNRARVGQALGLTETAVKNLETNGFELFPGSVYVRGYLKNYAKLLGTEEDELIAIYDRYCADNQLDNGRSTADLTSMPASQGDTKKIIFWVGSILAIGIIAFVAFSALT